MNYQLECEEILNAYRKHEELNYARIREILLECERVYAEGKEPLIPDEIYDALHEVYINTTGEIIRGDTEAHIKVEHDYIDLKGTVKKVHYITQKEKDEDPCAVEAHKVLYDWIKKTYDELIEADGDVSRLKYLGFWPKYDGCSLILSLDENGKVTKAITRGDEEFGVDKSKLFSNINMRNLIPKSIKGKVGLKTEAIMPKSEFNSYQNKFGDPDKPFVNERTAMTSLLNSIEFTSAHRKFLDLRPLMMYQNGHFISYTLDDNDSGDELGYGPIYMIPMTDKLVSKDSLTEIISKVKETIDSCDYECDGVIVRWYDEKSMEVLGRDRRNYINKFEIAYKFPKANNYTKIVDIEQDIGLFGNVSFTAVVEPIVINNKTITHASLGSYNRAKKLQLAKGDMVNIKFEIIPYLCIDSNCKKSGKKPIKLIDTCPYCGNELHLDNSILCCINHDCPSRIQGRINSFCKRANIAGIGEKMIEDLFHAGVVRSIPDLLEIRDKKDSFCSLDGFGEKSWKKLVKNIDKLELTQAQILAASGIPYIGPKNSEQISNIYYYNDILEIASKPNGAREFNKKLPDVLSERLYKGVNDNRELLEYLFSHIKMKKRKAKTEFNGRIIFTGFRNPKFKAHLEDLGFEVSDSVNKETILVIANDPAGNSSKLKVARSKSIPVVSQYDAYEKFNFKV